MNFEELTQWLKNQQDVLDEIISKAASKYLAVHEHDPNFGFDLSECQIESYNLSKGKDLCYDRPNIGISYALWYHGRRINTFLQYFCKEIFRSNEKRIEIFDLGAGTGAVQCAIALIQLGLIKQRDPNLSPSIKIINVDTSPFMMEFNRSYLWPTFCEKYPEIMSPKFQVSYSVNSWTSTEESDIYNPWGFS